MHTEQRISRKSGATVLSHALEIKSGVFPTEGAQFILDLGIRQEDKERMLLLLARRQEGKITAEETEDLESYIEADNLLSVLKAKAILALKKAR